jgi:serine/threonine protein kinase/Tfp pilus assembly protein PilF
MQHLQQISHYRVERLIGAGGMGEVYLAEDDRLRRKVALKLLPARFTKDEERVRRFQREARAASALNHPNIITIYDIGESEGVHYIATEYIDGVTLREKISGQQMSIADVLDVGIGAAGALAAAHEAGIIHRDIKPENLMLRRDGYVKVLDFGLAKLTDDGLSKDSHTGAVMGTLFYISPEQARGTQPDARSDLYALGAVLYEMITGRPPVQGDNFLDMAWAIANRRPVPPSTVVSGVPPELDHIVLKALEKEPADRYGSMRQLQQDLKTLRQELEFENKLHTLDPHRRTPALGQQPTLPMTFPPRSTSTRFVRLANVLTGTRTLVIGMAVLLAVIAVLIITGREQLFGGNGIDSVAVLPFVNASGNPNSDYLSDGISESVIDNLSQLPGLQVVARSTVFRYKSPAADPLAVGRELKVRGVVTGQLIQRGDTLVIRAALTDVKKGTQVWGQQYDRKMSDVLAVQRELSEEITSQLRTRLTVEERKRLTRRNADSNEAYQFYLKGHYFISRYNNDEAIKRGIGLLNQAIEQDPSYALAYAGIADAYYNLSNLYLPPKEAMPRAREAARRALELDDSLAEAHASLGLVKAWYEWDFKGGEREFRRAIDLEPNDSDFHRRYANFLMAAGQLDHALVESRKAEQLDPLSAQASWDVSRALFFARRYDEALEQAKRTIELDDHFAYAYYMQAEIATERKQFAQSVQLLNKAMQLSGRTPLLVAFLGYTYAQAGQTADAQKLIAELEARPGGYIALFLARIKTALGQHDEALRLLQQVYNDRSESIVWLKVDPTFDALRGDARFAELLKRVGF